MQMKDIVISAGVVIALVLGFLGLNGSSQVPPIGAVAGPMVFQHLRLNAGFTVGGSFATSSAGSFSWEASELREYNTYTLTPGAALTATLPASTTLDSMLPNKGDTRTMRIVNGASTAGRNITLAQGTGIILRGVNGTSTVIYAGRSAILHFYRSATSSPLGDVYVTVTPE